MTPLEIEILMHYHTRCIDYVGVETNNLPPAQTSFIDNFVFAGLLTDNYVDEDFAPKNEMRYIATERCHVYCHALQRVPLPEQQWIIPDVEEPK